MCRVMHGDNDSIARIHEQVRRWIGGEGIYSRIDGIGRRAWLWMSALSNECEVDIFKASFSSTGRIQYLTCYRVFREAVNVECSAPLGCIATVSSRPGCPTGWIELHLHESCSRMPGADRWIDDVLIAIWCAGA